MTGFLKSVLHRMNRNTKAINIFSKQLKKEKKIYYSNKLRKCTGGIKEKMDSYERYNWKIKI